MCVFIEGSAVLESKIMKTVRATVCRRGFHAIRIHRGFPTKLENFPYESPAFPKGVMAPLPLLATVLKNCLVQVMLNSHVRYWLPLINDVKLVISVTKLTLF